MVATRTYAVRERASGLDMVMAARFEVVAVFAVTAAVGLLYWLIHAAALNTPGYLDPWIYYALFQNFDYLYHAFYSAYYTSRLPWIIPGEAAHAALPSAAAFFVLHITFILAAGAAVYAALRRFFGRAIALSGYGALLLNVIFYNSHSDDYPDGPQITYVMLSMSTALLATRSRRPGALMFASGFFALAAVGTNLFDVFFLAAAAIAYVAAITPRPQYVARLIRDLVAFAGGALALLVLVGSYAKHHGGEFLFFMPSVRTAQTLSTKNWRIPGHAWMLSEPRLLATVLLVAVGAVVLLPSIRDWKRDQPLRVAVGLTASLAVATFVLCIWEFVFHGIAVFDIPYYFSVFTPLLILTAGSIAGIAVHRTALAENGRRAYAVAAIVAAGLPVWLIYGRDVDGLIGRTGFYVCVGLMALTTAVSVAFRLGPARLAPVAAVALAALTFFSLNFSAAASFDSARFHAADSGSSSYAGRFAAMHMTDQLIRFMRRSGLQPTGPYSAPTNFWFDAASDPAVNSIQSAYLYGWTAAGFDLPRIDATMKSVLRARQPTTLVLLCRAECGAGVSALKREGYEPRLRAATELAWGSERFSARAYTLRRFAALTPEKRFYAGSASPLLKPAGTLVRRWQLRSRSAGWQGPALETLQPDGTVTTTSHKWNYEAVSPSLTLPEGTYRVLLDGRVLGGGMDVGVLNLEKNVWISQRFYWRGQRYMSGRWMAAPFSLDGSTRIEIVLSNWVPVDQASKWRLGELRLVRVP
jgi:hypothetical protein